MRKYAIYHSDLYYPWIEEFETIDEAKQAWEKLVIDRDEDIKSDLKQYFWETDHLLEILDSKAAPPDDPDYRAPLVYYHPKQEG